jgi:Reverse transcriptase (RNA-dependent DNA polymerase)
MARRGFEVVRYADDFIVLCRTQEQAQEALQRVKRWLEANGLKLALRIHSATLTSVPEEIPSFCQEPLLVLWQRFSACQESFQWVLKQGHQLQQVGCSGCRIYWSRIQGTGHSGPMQPPGAYGLVFGILRELGSDLGEKICGNCFFTRDQPRIEFYSGYRSVLLLGEFLQDQILYGRFTRAPPPIY